MEPTATDATIVKKPDQLTERIHAPWSSEQVETLNLFQHCGAFHPFTSENGTILMATRDGWVERGDGPIVQTWAHALMVDREAIEERAKLFLSRLPHARNPSIPTYSRSEARRHYVHDERGFSSIRCYVSDGEKTEFHHEIIAHLSGGHHAHIQAVDPSGNIASLESEATNLTLHFAYLPKYIPAGTPQNASVSYTLPGSFMGEAKELLLTYRDKIQAESVFTDAVDAVCEKATQCGLGSFVHRGNSK